MDDDDPGNGPQDGDTDGRLADNRAMWEELADLHPRTDFYDVEAFLDGETTLLPLERRELDVGEGDRLCHLQCHFGLDTLSWAREGARVTGVDFAGGAIERARDLAERTGLDDRATFVEADVYDAPDALDEEFDVVFTSYGVLAWLPDLDRWAETAAALLRPGGEFYVAEVHPFSYVFHESTTAEDPAFGYPYFPEAGVQSYDEEGSYADWDADMEHTVSHEWPHSMGEIVSAVVDAGLSVTYLHEHPWACFRQFAAMEEDDEGRWWLPGLDHDLPLTFSLSARAPA